MTDPATIRYQASRSALLIADDAVLATRASDALAIAGGRIVAQFDWSVTPEVIDDHIGIDALLLEAEGVDNDRLEAVLPAADARAQASGALLIVALSAAQIDLVTAFAFGPHTRLLCAPTVAERVAALLVASEGDSVGDKSGEAESERLRRLNEEVARIAETLARLTRRTADGAPPERPAGAVGDRTLGYTAPPLAIQTVSLSPQDVRCAIRARRLRDQFFPAGLFEDPAWDMLLDLFAADLEGAKVSVSSLCIAAAVAPTTALRWIGRMSEAGLFERQPDPFDRRRAYMALSEKARAGMQGYAAALTRAGLAFA